ncbi:MAG: hypothetical protein K0U29_06830 [Gammaproteobacteria bacterium]|nr:hypothetical protein [Gammaproteobacteria bacterium]MCH9744629.1 hypothetical protein [Gammaproteobacteria bacterium]
MSRSARGKKKRILPAAMAYVGQTGAGGAQVIEELGGHASATEDLGFYEEVGLLSGGTVFESAEKKLPAASADPSLAFDSGDDSGKAESLREEVEDDGSDLPVREICPPVPVVRVPEFVVDAKSDTVVLAAEPATVTEFPEAPPLPAVPPPSYDVATGAASKQAPDAADPYTFMLHFQNHVHARLTTLSRVNDLVCRVNQWGVCEEEKIAIYQQLLDLYVSCMDDQQVSHEAEAAFLSLTSIISVPDLMSAIAEVLVHMGLNHSAYAAHETVSAFFGDLDNMVGTLGALLIEGAESSPDCAGLLIQHAAVDRFDYYTLLPHLKTCHNENIPFLLFIINAYCERQQGILIEQVVDEATLAQINQDLDALQLEIRTFFNAHSFALTDDQKGELMQTLGTLDACYNQKQLRQFRGDEAPVLAKQMGTPASNGFALFSQEMEPKKKFVEGGHRRQLNF